MLRRIILSAIAGLVSLGPVCVVVREIDDATGARIAVIADGGLCTIGPAAEVVAAETLSAIYRTEVLVEETPSGRRVCVPAWGQGAPRVRP